MSRKKTILIVSLVTIILLGLLTLSMFGVYKAEVYPDGDKRLIVRKISNENYLVNLINPKADSFLQTGDLIIHKNPLIYDESFRKKENYCSRIVGLPGDIVTIRESQVYVNNVVLETDYELWFLYRVSADTTQNFEQLLDAYNYEYLESLNNSKACNIITTPSEAEKMREIDEIVNIRQVSKPTDYNDSNMFSSKANYYLWNQDYMGPFMVPEEDITVFFNPRNIGIYKYIIESHEENLLEYNINDIKVNGELSESYVIKQNYYFVLNDNRYNRDDSRVWGFIPENQVVGKVISQK